MTQASNPASFINGATALYGIIGNPISHSLSPAFQTAGFIALGIRAVYVPFRIEDVTPELKDAFSRISLKGFNVTVPHKSAVIPLLDDIDPKAERLGSVNTVVIKNNAWFGYSTDGSGFVKSLTERNVDVAGKTIQLLGAGGSAVAIADALLENGVKELYVKNRTASNAEAMIERLTDRFDIPIHLGDCQTRYDVLVNATSAGLTDERLPCSDAMIKNARYVADIIYRQTPLLKKAAAYNIPHQDGLGMLLHQGALAFELWTGMPAPIDAMKNAILAGSS